MIPVNNKSISDVCFQDDADPYFCTRFLSISIISVFTGSLCLGKIGLYHYKKVKCLYQLTIFYCALMECVCFVIHWVFFSYDLPENLGYWFRIVQLLVCCYNYANLASRVFNREELYKKKLKWILHILTVYFASLLVWMLTVPKYRFPHRCVEFHHPVYMASDFVLTQIFMISGIYLTTKMNQVNMASDQLMEQKKQLWGVIIAFEFEGFVGIVYDTLLDTVAAGPRGCGGFLYQENAGAVILFVIIKILRLYLSIWVMLYMFNPKSTDYSEPPNYGDTIQDPEPEFFRPRIGSIATGYAPNAFLDNDYREPLINNEENYRNYFKEDTTHVFGERPDVT